MTLEQRKAEALKSYKEAREAHANNATPENGRTFCDAKRLCRLLGVRV